MISYMISCSARFQMIKIHSTSMSGIVIRDRIVHTSTYRYVQVHSMLGYHTPTIYYYYILVYTVTICHEYVPGHTFCFEYVYQF